MTTKMKLLFIVCTAALLDACAIGNGMICGPQTPVAYCDSEAYQRLAHPKPYMQFWEKSNLTDESRLRDWQVCGGERNGNFTPHIVALNNEKIPSEADTSAANERLRNKLEHCMRKKGYRYIGGM